MRVSWIVRPIAALCFFLDLDAVSTEPTVVLAGGGFAFVVKTRPVDVPVAGNRLSPLQGAQF